MTETQPDYSKLKPPDEKSSQEYTTHERRGDILQTIIEAGEPSAVNQRELAEKYGVHESTVSRDMDRLRESITKHLGTEAKFTTRTLYQHVVQELLAEDDWRATKAAWDVARK
jgi:IS30 family transposase